MTAVCLARVVGSHNTPRNARTDRPKSNRTTNYRNAKSPNPVPNRMPANRTDQDQPARRTVCVVGRKDAYELTAPKLWRRVIRKDIAHQPVAPPVQHNRLGRIDANLVPSAVYRVEY